MKYGLFLRVLTAFGQSADFFVELGFDEDEARKTAQEEIDRCGGPSEKGGRVLAAIFMKIESQECLVGWKAGLLSEV